MKNNEQWQAKAQLDLKSPTCLSNKRTGKPLGSKIWMKNGTYQWIFLYDTGKKCLKWSVPRTVYELHHGVEVPRHARIIHLDGNKDNMNPHNLAMTTVKGSYKHTFQEAVKAWEELKTVPLPYGHPDYYKHPKRWKEADSRELLRLERLRRKHGESKPPVLGRPTRWK